MEPEFYIVSPGHNSLQPRKQANQNMVSSDPGVNPHSITAAYSVQTGALIASGDLVNPMKPVKIQQRFFDRPNPESTGGFDFPDQIEPVVFASARSSENISWTTLQPPEIISVVRDSCRVCFPFYEANKRELTNPDKVTDPESRICGNISAYMQDYIAQRHQGYKSAVIVSKFDDIDGCNGHQFIALEDSKHQQWLVDATYKQFLLDSMQQSELNMLPDVMIIKVTNKLDIEQKLSEHGIPDSMKHIWANALAL